MRPPENHPRRPPSRHRGLGTALAPRRRPRRLPPGGPRQRPGPAGGASVRCHPKTPRRLPPPTPALMAPLPFPSTTTTCSKHGSPPPRHRRGPPRTGLIDDDDPAKSATPSSSRGIAGHKSAAWVDSAPRKGSSRDPSNDIMDTCRSESVRSVTRCMPW